MVAVESAKFRDFCVRAGGGWKSKLVTHAAHDLPGNNEATQVLAACKDDIIKLWEDPAVRALLARKEIRLQDTPGL